MPADSPDDLVIEKARSIDAALISLNGDVVNIIAYPPSRFPGIIALQLHNHPEVTPAVVARLLKYLEALPGQDSLRGKLVIVEPHRVRVRG
jgi:hypothetical protein